jgi:membrane protease subunit (stomatin/prohibitin family)
MQQGQGQGTFTRGIYQFEDHSGAVLAARVPARGAADLYNGTNVIVRPNQVAILVYKGEYADFLTSGLKILKTENTPVLTRLANFALGFQSPLLAEIWFFSLSNFNGRRWGTKQSVISSIQGKPVPLKAFGTYSVRILNPRKLHSTMIGTRAVYTIADVEEYIQGEILENLPDALKIIQDFAQINTLQDEVCENLQDRVNDSIEKVGLELSKLQFLSIQPPKEIMQALDSKIAMDLIGDQRQFLLYNAAKGLRADPANAQAGFNQDPVQVMMGMMLAKGIAGEDYKQAERAVGFVDAAHADRATKLCAACGSMNLRTSKFCSQCGGKL